MNKLVFIGGDIRNFHIYEKIKAFIGDAQITAFSKFKYDSQKIKTANTLIFPTVSSKDGKTLFSPLTEDKILIEDILKDCGHVKAIIGGKLAPEIKSFCEMNGILCREYIEDERFKTINAIPTAEGAISIAIENTNKTLWNSKCLVTGYGSIGKYLCYILTSFGAQVTASARKDKDFDELSRKNIDYINTYSVNENIEKYDIIFNTVPHKIFNNEALLKLSKDALIIDLASAPYGLEHERAKEYKCKIILASSLPGKYSPVTAADIALKAILRVLKEVESYD